MFNFKKIVFVCVTILMVQLPAGFPQINPGDRFKIKSTKFEEDTPAFDLRVFNTAADSVNLSRLIFHLSIPYEALQFIKNKNGSDQNKQFRADVEATVTFFDSTGKQIAQRQWQHTVYSESFKNTRATENFAFTQSMIDLPPGMYKFKVELKDLETGRMGFVEGLVKSDDFFKGSFTLSDILFLNSVAFLSDSADVGDGDSDSIYVYYEVYNVPEKDTIFLEYKINTVADTTILGEEKAIQSKGPINKEYITLNKKRSLQTNFYINLKARYHDNSIEKTAHFRSKGNNQNQLFSDLSEAIEQLIYVANKKEIAELKKLKGEEQLAAFNEFWKKKDRTPETRQNEYMNEYYNRINVVNEKFGGHLPGWRTQRGMVFIKLGSPQYVDEPISENYFDPISGRKSYIIWYYPAYNRRVIFELLGTDYRISNYHEVFDLLNDNEIRL